MPIKFRCYHCKKFMGISRSKAGNVVDCPTCGRTVRVPELDGTVKPLPPVGLNLDDSKLKNALNHLAEPDVTAGGEGADLDQLKGELQQLMEQPESAPAESDRINVIDPGPVAPDEVIELPIPERKAAIELSPADAQPPKPAEVSPGQTEPSREDEKRPDSARPDETRVPTTTATPSFPPQIEDMSSSDPSSDTDEEQNQAPSDSDDLVEPAEPDEDVIKADDTGETEPEDANRKAVIAKSASTSLAESDGTIDGTDNASNMANAVSNDATVDADEPSAAPASDIPKDLLATLGTVAQLPGTSSQELQTEAPPSQHSPTDPPTLGDDDGRGHDGKAPEGTPNPVAPKPEIVESQPTLDSASVSRDELNNELTALAAMAPSAGGMADFTASHPQQRQRAATASPVVWMLVAFALFAGFLIGRSFGSNEAEPVDEPKQGKSEKVERKTDEAKLQEAKAANQGQGLVGRITYRTALDECLPDSGARILLLPRQATVTEQLGVIGLRPGDSGSDQEAAEDAVTQANGVAVLTSGDGTYSAHVAEPGNYHVIVLSKFHRRGNDAEITAELTQALTDYFPEADHRKLLGHWGVSYGRIRIEGKSPIPWDHVFD